jgi:hypothetical protein
MKSLRLLGVCPVMLLLVSVPPGCSKSSAPPVYVKVSGKVVDAQGKPVPALNIRFFPTENVESFRVSQDAPRLRTPAGPARPVVLDYPLAIANKDGTFALSMNGGDIEGARPGKYRVTITGFSKEQKEKIPLKYRDADTSPLDVTIPNRDVSDLVLQIE